MIGETLSPARAGRGIAVVWIRRRERLDPGLPDRGAADDAVQKIEGLGQHVVVGNRLKLWNIHPLEKSPQPERLGRRRPSRTRGQRVARVENHSAAVLHKRGDARTRSGLGLRQPGDDRPIDERIESEFVAPRIQRRGIGKFQRRCGRRAPASAQSTQVLSLIDGQVAGYDVSEPS